MLKEKKSGSLVAFVLTVSMVFSLFAMIPFQTVLGAGEDLNGVVGEFYTLASNDEFRNDFQFTDYHGSYVDPTVNIANTKSIFESRTGSGDRRGVRWTSRLRPNESGMYNFYVRSDNGFRLWLDGELLIDYWYNDWDDDLFTKAVELEAGKNYDLKIEYFQVEGGAYYSFKWGKDVNNSHNTQDYQPVPKECFFLPENFAGSVVDSIDSSGANLAAGEIDGTLVINGSGFTQDTKISIAKSTWEITHRNVECEVLSDTQLKVTVPKNIKVGVYSVYADTNGIMCPAKDFFVVTDPLVQRDEYPRPDYSRSDTYINLNGEWKFKFDENDVGVSEEWYNKDLADLNCQTILVPFSWESPAGRIGLENKTTAWYQRSFDLGSEFTDKNIVIYFGAVDWKCNLWVNGVKVDPSKGGDEYLSDDKYMHIGGYTPFEYDITEYVKVGQANTITLQVNDEGDYEDHSYPALVGKQGHNAPCGYIRTSGIWQTVIIEGRLSETQMKYAHATPDIDNKSVTFDIALKNVEVGKTYTLKGTFESVLWDQVNNVNNPTGSAFTINEPVTITEDSNIVTVTAVIGDNQKLWHPDEANLYEGTFTLSDGATVLDKVDTYFGQRKISTADYHSNGYEYIYINNEPIFSSGLLDQGFWEEGGYTAPTEEALKYDIQAMRSRGFNMIRKHLKIEDPLQYLWTDRLGMMVWQDMPHATNMNGNGSPGPDNGPDGKGVFEGGLKELTERDYNHPSVVAYILFNETWGISINNATTTAWRRGLYNWVKDDLDPTRLVEDMSPCNFDHIQPTDMNTFHMYPGDYGTAKRDIDHWDSQVYPGSTWNFHNGEQQDGDPWLNSEYGGVGAGSGDHDVSWCFKYQTDIQRLRQKLNGFVYTEPYDIEYERNGFLTYDRNDKIFGYDEIAYGGFDVNYLTQADYVGFDVNPMVSVVPGGVFRATIGRIKWSVGDVENATLKWRFDGTDVYGNKIDTGISGSEQITYKAYTYETTPINFTIPKDNRFIRMAGTVTVWIEDADGNVLAKNFTNLKVIDNGKIPEIDKLSDTSYVLRETSAASNTVSNGIGAITYTYTIPNGFDLSALKNLRIMAEASAVKAGDGQTAIGKETPSDLTVSVNGYEVDTVLIPDNPRDMRGTLSLSSGRASAGNFGYLINLNISEEIINQLKADNAKTISVTYEVQSDAANKNGVRIYNSDTGRYAVDPSLLLNPSEVYMASEVVSTDSITKVADVGGKNYSVEADVSGEAGLVVRSNGSEGYKVHISSGAVYLSNLDGTKVLASKGGFNFGDTAHIKVTVFDENIRVYANNDPEAVLEVYDSQYADGYAAVIGNGKLTNLAVSPETYQNNMAVTQGLNVQYVESFGNQDNNNSTNPNTTFNSKYTLYGTEWTGDSAKADWQAVNDKLQFDTGAGHKAMNEDFVFDDGVIEGDITVNGTRSGNAKGNFGFMLRTTEPTNLCDGANGYFVGVGINADNDSAVGNYRGGFIELGVMNQSWRRLAMVRAPQITAGSTHRLKVVFTGPRIRVYLDDETEPYVDVYDTTYSQGYFGFRGFHAIGSVDNVVVSSAPRYDADFENNNIAEWVISSNTSVANNTVTMDGSGYAYVGSDIWTDESVTAQVNLEEDAHAGIMARARGGVNAVSGYSASLNASDGTVSLLKVQSSTNTLLKSRYLGISSGINYDVKITAINNVITVYVNGAKVLSAVDNTFANGAVGLYTVKGKAAFDNFVSTDQFDYVNNFEDGALSQMDVYNGDWSVSNNELHVTNVANGQKVADGYATWSNVHYSFDMRLNKPEGNPSKSNAGMIFRASDMSVGTDNLRGYVVGLNISAPGNAEPSGVEIGNLKYAWKRIDTVEKSISFGEWYTVEVILNESNIQVYLDGEKIADFNDEYYRYGQFGFRTYATGASYRNVEITQLDTVRDEVDKEELANTIASTGNLNKDRYTADSWAVLQTALEKAIAVFEDSGADQAAVNEATSLLLQAIEKLEEKPVNKSLLEATVAYAKEQDITYLNGIVKEQYLDALDKAEKVLADVSAAQEEVNAAADELIKMIHMLSYTSDPRELEGLIALAEEMEANLDLYKNNASKQEFIDALSHAKSVLAEPTSLDADYKEAYNRLKAAMDALEYLPNTNQLEKIIERGNKIVDESEKYLDIGWDSFIYALNNAKTILANSEEQDEIDAAVLSLHNTILALRLKPNKDLLQDLLNQAKKVNAALFTKESIEMLETAKRTAQEIVDAPNATQDDVNNAANSIKDALRNLEPVNTEGKEALNAIYTDSHLTATGNAVGVPKTGEVNSTLFVLFLFLASGVLLVAAKQKKD